MPAHTISADQLSKLIDVGQRHVRKLTADGVLFRAKDDDGKELQGRYDMVLNVRAYVAYLRAQGRLDEASESAYVRARNARMATLAEEAGLRLQVIKGKLHRTEDVELVMTNRDSAIKARLLAIPSRVGRLLQGKTDLNEIRDILNGELYAILDELEAYDPRTFNERNETYLASLFPEESQRANGDGPNEQDEQ